MTLLIIIILTFCLLRLGVALYNYSSKPVLLRTELRFSDRVSILIPARNEAGNISALLTSLSKLNYANFEVIVMDDHSTDETFSICAAFAVSDSRFRVVKGKPLPQGWLGKNFACYQLAELAGGDFLLFLDADTVVSADFLAAALERMHRGELDLLSVFPDQQMRTAGENLTVPLMHYLLLSLLPLSLISDHPDPVFSAASGQAMLFRAQSYRKHQWHWRVRDCIAEDLKIMKLLKRQGCRGQGLLAAGMISCRMYHSYEEGIFGFAKNFMAPFDNKVWLFLLFVLLSVFGPLVVLATLNPLLICLMILMIAATKLLVSNISRQGLLTNILLHPFQLLTLGVIAYFAVSGARRGTLVWKDRKLEPQMAVQS